MTVQVRRTYNLISTIFVQDLCIPYMFSCLVVLRNQIIYYFILDVILCTNYPTVNFHGNYLWQMLTCICQSLLLPPLPLVPLACLTMTVIVHAEEMCD